MTPIFIKVFLGIAPTLALLLGPAFMFAKEKRVWSVLQLIGAGGIVMVLFAHVCEALQLFPWMQWGQQHSIGHYLDLSSAIVGITLFPLGYLLHALALR